MGYKTGGKYPLPSGVCAVCGKAVKVYLDGEVVPHKNAPGGEWCDGSYKSARGAVP